MSCESRASRGVSGSLSNAYCSAKYRVPCSSYARTCKIVAGLPAGRCPPRTNFPLMCPCSSGNEHTISSARRLEPRQRHLIRDVVEDGLQRHIDAQIAIVHADDVRHDARPFFELDDRELV